MTYYVYENWVAEGHKARVHRADCSDCNEGKGKHPNAGTKNGMWHGSFPTVEAALQAAERTGGNVSQCKRCLPK